MRDHFVAKATIRLPVSIYKSENVFEVLGESFGRVKIHTGRVSSSQKG